MSKEMEEGYLLRLHAELIEKVQLLIKLVIGARTAMVIRHAFQYAGIMGTRPLEGLGRQLWIMASGMNCAALLVTCLLYLATRCSRCCERLGPVAWEVILFVVAVMSMCGLVYGSPTSMCKIMGHSLKEAMGEDAYDSDSRILLHILSVVTVMHVILPLRWCSLVPLELASVVLYAVSAHVIGSSEPSANVYMNTFFLTYLVAMSSIGKRAWELLDRSCFLAMIQEKQERCRAEFELSQVQEGSPGHAQPAEATALSSSVGSRAAGSSDAFDVQTEMDHSVADHLRQLAAVGVVEHWWLDDAQVTVLQDQLLGSGSFGEVRAGIFCGKLVAVKQPRFKAANADAETLRNICNELRVTRHLKHPNIVTTFGAVVQPHSRGIALVMEFVDGVRLSDLMASGIQVSLAMRYEIMVGVCDALFYMHTRSPSVAHGDLKGENIMVVLGKRSAHPKLLDFGLSRVLTRHARPMGGTLAWAAPEVLTGRGAVKCSADIYSLGHIIAFAATGIPPGLGLTATLIRRALRRSRPLVPKWPSGCAFRSSCKPLVTECVARPEGDRPKIDEIHRRLLSLPQDEALSEMRGPFIEGLKLVAGRADPPADSAPSGDGLVAQEADSGAPRSSLSTLLEDQASQEECADAAPPPSRPAKLQPYSTLETCGFARATTLDRALARWNYPVPSGFCCERHALAQLAIDTIGEHMTACPCDFTRLPRRDLVMQCPHCGLLLARGTAACDACGFHPSSLDDASSDASEPQRLRASL